MRRLLVVAYDVTGFTDDEVARLEMEAVVQGESSDADEDSPGHPDVHAVDSEEVAWGDVNEVKSKSLAGMIDLFARMRRAAAG